MSSGLIPREPLEINTSCVDSQTAAVGNTAPLSQHCEGSVQVGHQGTPLSTTNAYHASEESVKLYNKSKYIRKKRMLKHVRQALTAYDKWSQIECQTDIEDSTKEIRNILDRMSSVNTIPLPGKALYQVEGIVALFFALSKAVDTVQALAIASLYLQRFYDKSVVEMIVDQLATISVSDQAGELDQPNWLELLKLAQTNWKLVVNNEGFAHLGHVLSIMLSLGLCDQSNVDFSLSGMKLFTVHALKKQSTATDLIDAVFSTVCFFVEGGYECFKQKSLKPLLFGDLDMQKMEKNIAECEQYAEFAKTGDLEKRTGLHPNDFDARLQAAMDSIQTLIKTNKNPVTLKLLRDKLEKLRKINTHFQQTRVQGGLREAPYGMGFYGGSGVGKSSVSNILMICILMHNGYAASDDRLIALNESDKYMSTYRSYINGIFIDDIGNTKADFVEKAPTTKIIEIINNVRTYANMAEADMKGKVSIEPRVVITTKNVKNMCAEVYSNEPASVTRREKCLATVRVRKEFATKDMLDQEKVRQYYDDKIPLIPDLWEIDLETSFPVSQDGAKHASVGWEYVNFGGKEMKNVSIFEVIRFACQDAKKHFANQTQLVNNSTNLAEKMEFCSQCKFPSTMCSCPTCAPVSAEEVGDQFGEFLAPILMSRYFVSKNRVTNLFEKYMNKMEQVTAESLVASLDWLENSPYASWTNYVPTKFLEDENFYNVILATNVKYLRKTMTQHYVNWGFLAFMCVMSFFLVTKLSVLPFFYCLKKIAQGVEIQKAILYAQVKKDNQAMPSIFKTYRDATVQYITGACVALSFLYLLAQTWKCIQLIPSSQGNLQPKSIEEIVSRDDEKKVEDEVAKEMNWSTVNVAPIPCAEQAKTQSCDRLQALALTNTGLFSYVKDAKTYGCDIFFMESNLALVPTHMWKDEETVATVQTGASDAPARKFQFRLSKTFSKPIPDTDFSLVWVPNGGSWKDLTNYLPEGEFRNVPAKLAYKYEKDGKMKTIFSNLFMQTGPVGNASANFYGASYNLDFNTFVGLCMAPIVSDTKQTVLAGFHLGGRTGGKFGVCGTLMKDQYFAAREVLSKVPGVSLAASEGVMKTELYDIKFLQSKEIHAKSPTNKLPEGAHLKVYGSCTGGAKYFSNVVELPILPHVEEVCGVKNQHGAPKFHLGDAWQKSLDVSCKPSIGVEGDLLSKAVVDYIEPLQDQIGTIPELKEHLRPLTRMENLCGIDGCRFIDKLSPKTSIGYPLAGPKSKFITALSPEDHPDFACPAELEEKFWTELERMETEYSAGRRCYFIFKACLKDEPTKLSKDKVRVFQASSAAAQLAIRKYFLPLARVISLFPLIAECGVGINSMGPEFSDLVEHMRKHGADRILAGDYSKYDLRMPAQLTLAAFDALIMMAEHFGYSEEDLKIMRGIATDVCYPVMAYNGDLLELLGSNPSGQNLTVYLNSIVNSLLLRSAYFHIYKGREVPSFREVASMMTYGDDVKGSIKKGYDEFNHVSYANFLKARDMVFTMPDKESLPIPYMTDQDADFLKRKSRWCSDLNLWQGPLDEDSIFKSLMTVLKSKAISENEQSMQNIDGALREWFNYGRDHYEMRRLQMNEVALRGEIAHGCKMLDQTYDDCLDNFRARYLSK